MKEKLKYKLSPHWTKDEYDCDYTGNTYSLISEMNQKLTKIFLTDELKQKFNKKLNGKPYPSVYICLSCLSDVGVGISVEFVDDLVATTPYMERYGHLEALDTILSGILIDYLSNDLEYNLRASNAFVEKLITEHPEMEKYFEKIED